MAVTPSAPNVDLQLPPMIGRRQRRRAFMLYMRRPARQFLPTFCLLVATLALGTAVFAVFGDAPAPDLAESFIVTAHLLFGNTLNPVPAHPLARALYLVLPLVGVLAILDAIIRFSYHLMRRDEASREWNTAMALTLENHVILIGLGKVGLRILQQLHRLGEQVVVLEKDEHCAKLSWARLHGVPVVIGNTRDEGILEDLNIAKAKAIVPATSDDLANLELALDARKRRPDIRVVLRLFDQELAHKVREGFGIDTAFSTSELAAPVFALSSVDPAIHNSFYVGDTLLVVGEVTVGEKSPMAGQALVNILPLDCVALAHRASTGQSAFPVGSTKVERGDGLTLQTTLDGFRRMRRIARGE